MKYKILVSPLYFYTDCVKIHTDILVYVRNNVYFCGLNIKMVMRLKNKHFMPCCMYILMMTLSSCQGIFSALYFKESTIKELVVSRFKAHTDTHIDTLININGYYAKVDEDTILPTPFTLKKDGSVESWVFDEYLYFKKENIDLSDKGMGHTDGSYRIKGDTIIKYNFWGIYNIGQSIIISKYKVIDRNTLLLCESYDYASDTCDVNINTVYRFIPVKGLPPSNGYLKRKRWMWKNKIEWFGYRLKRFFKPPKKVKKEKIWKRNM
ncbi:MAG: hypothetical protein J6C05_10210 [Prevotella sp.]|nr:hypothetical protein [Prevotella sp.]